MSILNIEKSYIGDFDFNEIKRYMGCKRDVDKFDELIVECIEECKDNFDYRVSYKTYPVIISDDIINFGFTSVKSKDLSKNLNGCNYVIIFAATVGIEIDRLIGKYSNISPLKSLCFNSIGAERIEELCDRAEEILLNDYTNSRPRFSPGYGDLNIDFQKVLFNELNCTSEIGVYLSNSIQMTPSKSVTAIIGANK